MEETVQQQIPTGKIFHERAFWVGVFLGGPLVAGYLFAQNFKTLNKPAKIRATWFYTLLATLIIFGVVYSIPDSVNLPNQMIPIVYSVLAYGLFKKYQEEEAQKHFDAGGSAHGWGRVIGVSVVGLSITMAVIFAVVFITEEFTQPDIITKRYGVTVKHEIDFDKSNVSEKEIDKIADGFIEAGFFDLSVPKYVYVFKKVDKYEIYISVVEGLEKDQEGLIHFVDLRDQMENFLPENQIEFKLVVDYIDNVVKVLK